MRIAVLGDTHITEDSIEELGGVFKEVWELGTSKTTLVIVGDFYDNKRPSPDEIYFGTKMISRSKHYFRNVILLTGNHAMLGKMDISNVDYLKYLGITVSEEYLFPLEKIYFGHFMTNKSLLHYGSWDKDRPITELRQYKLTILGHQHSFQELEKDIYHIGSCRWVHFGEVRDKEKYIMTINNDKYDFIELTSPVPMIEVFSLEELLDVDFNSKVLITYKDFEQYKNEVIELNKKKNNYYQFKIKLDFPEIKDYHRLYAIPEDYKVMFTVFLHSIKDMEVRQMLEKQFNDSKDNYIK